MDIRSDSHLKTPDWQFPPEYYSRSLDALDTALTKIAVYQAWHELDPGLKYSIDERFAALPVTTKKIIRENFPQGLLPRNRDLKQGLDSGEIDIVETSGTTDDKVSNIWNQPWWDASEKSSWELNSCMAKTATGAHREAILVNAWNGGFISDSLDLPMEKRRIGRFLYLTEKTSPTLWTTRQMERMVEELNLFQPAVLEANPSLLAKFCRYAITQNKPIYQPPAIIFTYEFATKFHYRQIRRVFQSPIVSSYGTTETGCVFMQCEEGKFHQNCQFCRVDFQPLLPEHGGPLQGRILVTPFQNSWNYMLRFDPGDMVCLEKSGKCACGRNSGMILTSINGRKVNLTLTASGRLVTLGELDNALSRLSGIDEYKLVQSDAKTYDLQLVSQRTDKDTLRVEATGILKTLYGWEARIAVNFPASIAPEFSGKYLVAKTLFPLKLEDYLEK